MKTKGFFGSQQDRFGQGLTFRQRTEAEVTRPLAAPVQVAVTTVTNSPATLLTVEDERFFYIRDFGVCNIAGANITITVHLVPSGGSATNANKVYDGYTVLSNDSGTLTALVGSTLQPGDFIRVVTDNATGANFWLDGIEFEGGVLNV